MRVAALVGSLLVGLLGGCSPASDVGYAGAFRVVRESVTSDGGNPDAYTMRADEDLCENETGRCYVILGWAKGRQLRGYKGDCIYRWSVTPTGQLESMWILD